MSEEPVPAMPSEPDSDDISSADASLLLQRARALAVTPEAKDQSEGQSLEVVEFGLGGECYAFELTHVREVAALVELTPLPGVPGLVMGVICLRGQILPVLDLRKLFGLPELGLSNSRQVIVLESAEMEMGILAESIRGVRLLRRCDLQATLRTLTDVRADYLEGLTADATVVLSASKLLADGRLVVEQET